MSTGKEYPKVGIIVLNWNSYPDTRNCLRSLEVLEYPNYSLYVVDNGSADNSVERLNREFRDPNVISLDENRGFAGGNNAGIREAIDEGCKYVLLLNNDTTVESGFLTKLVRTGERFPRAGVVGGTIFDESGKVWYSGGAFNDTLVRYDRKTKPRERSDAFDTDVVVGTMMFLRSAAITRVGALDENYWFGGEDTELCYRLKQGGWQVLVKPSARIEHAVGNTGGTLNPFSAYHSSWNSLYFSQKHHSVFQKVVFLTYFTFWNVFKLCKWTLRGRSRHALAAIRGIVDFYWANNAKNEFL